MKSLIFYKIMNVSLKHNIDTAINVYDYQYPIKRYISSLFITIKSNMLTKMNIYFKPSNNLSSKSIFKFTP